MTEELVNYGWDSHWDSVKDIVDENNLLDVAPNMGLILDFAFSHLDFEYTLIDGVYKFGPESLIKALGFEIVAAKKK